jgi:pimeloyl-ACP methyl ester carboxylesterase
MPKATSKDGTTIGYDKKGQGPAVILVDGAMGYRAMGFGNQLQDLLAQHFTVYAYDRRGRGESSNSKPFAVEREVEDIEALIDAAGGTAFVYGISSGACLALEAAIRLDGKIKRLALFEPPYNSEPGSRQAWWDYNKQLGEFVAADRRGDAVELFMKFVGTPAEMIQGMRKSPGWPAMESVAPTLPYDAAAMGKDRAVPVERVSKVTAQTLILDGGANLKIMPFMHASADSLAKAMPHGQQRTLEGQTHAVEAQALAPVLTEFFKS